MAQFAVLIYTQHAPTAELTSEERDAHGTYADELIASGEMVVAVALQPAGETAKAVRGDGVTDGPFVEGTEFIAGFYVVEADDLDAALDIARRNPIVQQGGGVEVRPIEGAFLPSRTPTT